MSVIHHNEEAETALVASLILDGPEVWDVIESIIPTSKAFVAIESRLIYLSARYLARDGRMPRDSAEWAASLDQIPADSLGRFPEGSVLSQIGGYAGLARITNSSGTSAGFQGTAKLVFENWQRREMLRAAEEALEAARRPGFKIDDLGPILDRKRSEIGTQKTMTMDEAWDLAEQGHIHSGALWGVDCMDDGMPMLEGCVYVLAAPPGGGKTALACQSLYETSKTHHTAIISLEMTATSLGKRCRDYFGQNREGTNLSNIEIVEGRGVYAENIGSMILSRARMGCRLVVVDYLQLLGSQNRKSTLYERVAMASNEIARAAKEGGCSVMELNQLNRGRDKDPTKPPRMADLKGAGEIEQDADWIGFLWKDPEDHRPEETKDWDMVLTVEKDRHHGNIGHKPLTWHRNRFTFTNRRVQAAPPAQRHPKFDEKPGPDEDLFPV